MGGDTRTVGVLLMTFGSATSLDDVARYMASVRGGRPAAPELVTEFRRRYEIIGGSPLIRITREQAAALERMLNREAPPGERFVARAGMRHSPPSIADAMAELAREHARRIVAIVMSPQYSPIIMGGYNRDVEAAKALLPLGAVVTVAGAWHRSPDWIATLAQRVREAIGRVPEGERAKLMTVFTAHSLPRSVVDREPFFIDQLMETVEAVAQESGLDRSQWRFAYQSAGHTPEEWLKPDLKDVLPDLVAAGYARVLVAPVQFLADHLEILYDIDVAAREEAEAAGIGFSRIEMPNTSPSFIRALVGVVKAELAREASAAG